MKPQEIVIDPEFRDAFPPLSDEERTQLEANLKADGCRDSLVVWKGQNILLDGHNRYDICTANDIMFFVDEIDLADRAAAEAWIISNQLGRRNIPLAARIAIAKRIEPQLKEAAREKQRAAGKTHGRGKDNSLVPTGNKLTADPNSGKTIALVASVAGVGRATVGRYNYVEKHGDEQTIADMKASKITIGAAYERAQKAKGKTPRTEREKAKRAAESTNGLAPGVKRLPGKPIDERLRRGIAELASHADALSLIDFGPLRGTPEMAEAIETVKGVVRALNTFCRTYKENG